MNDARRLQRLLASKGRPMWQRRILRIVSPAWRAKERRVAESVRLVDAARREPQELPEVLTRWQAMRDEENAAWHAYREGHAAAMFKAAGLIRRVEEDGVPWAEVKAEFWAAMNSGPPRPVPVTEEEEAEAYRLIREHLATRDGRRDPAGQ